MARLRVVCGVLTRGGEILAARRLDVNGWELPGGKIEAGETPEHALRRELYEELGVNVTTCWLLDEVEGRTQGDEGGMTMSLACYICPAPIDSAPECREHAELRWLSRSQLLDLDWLPADRILIERIGMWWDDLFAESHL